jgi:hypothetical protein
VEVRLAWAVVLPAWHVFAGGTLYARARRTDDAARPSPGSANEE